MVEETKIAVWKTGHPIADTVADAFGMALGEENLVNVHPGKYALMRKDYGFSKWKGEEPDAHIGYGILRGVGEEFRELTKCSWFNIDRGYTNPGHFQGNYRISYRGTQARWHEGIPRKPIDIDFHSRIYDKSKPVLICPPTEYVCEFFGIPQRKGYLLSTDWHVWATHEALKYGNAITREKGDQTPIDWDNISGVITFNSSVGWEAIRRGIPCISDPDHSLVGSYFAYHGCDTLDKVADFLHSNPNSRVELFESMAAHQFTLQEIREGKAWPLVKHYLCSSGTIQEKRSLLKSAPIPSNAEPSSTFRSIS